MGEIVGNVIRYVLMVGFFIVAGVFLAKDIGQRHEASHAAAPLLTASTANGTLVTVQGSIDPSTPPAYGKLVAFNKFMKTSDKAPSMPAETQAPPLSLMVANLGNIHVSGAYRLIGRLTPGNSPLESPSYFGVTPGQLVSVLGTVQTDPVTHERMIQAQALAPGEVKELALQHEHSAGNWSIMAGVAFVMAIFLLFVNPFAGFMWFRPSGVYVQVGRPPSNPIEWLTDFIRDFRK
jgi:hypothetical protein